MTGEPTAGGRRCRCGAAARGAPAPSDQCLMASSLTVGFTAASPFLRNGEERSSGIRPGMLTPPA